MTKNMEAPFAARDRYTSRCSDKVTCIVDTTAQPFTFAAAWLRDTADTDVTTTNSRLLLQCQAPYASGQEVAAYSQVTTMQRGHCCVSPMTDYLCHLPVTIQTML